MIPVDTIKLPDWLLTDSLKILVKVLGEDQVRLVGGCVRNAIIDTYKTDIDLATVRKPKELINILNEANIKNIPTGVDHGTITAVLKDSSFEITTLRKDISTDGRRAIVAFTDQWQEDAQRRDFTINALYADLSGHIYDPTGQGIEDLRHQKIRFIGNPVQRIREDYLRILRFFRFHTWYGEGALDPDGLKACITEKDGIKSLSKERVTQEILKLLCASDPDESLTAIKQNSIIEGLFHTNYCARVLRRYYNNASHIGEPPDPIAGLATLCAFDPDHANAVATGLFTLSNQQTKRLSQFCMEAGTEGGLLDHEVKKTLYSYGRDQGQQIIMVRAAQSDYELQPNTLKILKYWDIPKFPITGADLIKAGHEPGPALGKKLKLLEQEWLSKAVFHGNPDES